MVLLAALVHINNALSSSYYFLFQLEEVKEQVKSVQQNLKNRYFLNFCFFAL